MSTKNRAWRILLPTHHSLSNPSSNAHRFPGKMGGSTAGRLPQHGAPALSIVSFFFFFFSGQPLPCHSHPPPLTSTVLFRHSFSSRCQSRRAGVGSVFSGVVQAPEDSILGVGDPDHHRRHCRHPLLAVFLISSLMFMFECIG